MWFLLEGWKSCRSSFDSHLALLRAGIAVALTDSSRIVRNV